MSRKRKSDLQTGQDQEMVTTKAHYKPSEDRTNKYVYATDKNHSRLLCPHDPAYHYDSILSNEHAAAHITLKERITLGYFDRPTAQDLEAAVENHLTASIGNVESESGPSSTQISKAKLKQLNKDDETKSQQKLAISLNLDKFPHEYIVTKVGVKPQTLKKWIRLYNKGELLKEHKPPANLKVQQKFLDAIGAYLNHPKRMCTTLNEIRKYLLSTFPMDLDELSVATVYRWVKKNGFSRKRLSAHVKDRNSAEMVTKRYAACLKLAHHLLHEKEVIYIDEVSFNQDLVPIYGYSQIGKPAFSTKRVKGQNHSVVAAVTRNRFLGFQIFHTSVAAKEFGFFIISLLNAYPEIRDSRNNYIFYMDNARTHKAKAIQDLLSQIITCYSAPYSPFLNPIEEVFGTWKHFYRKLIHASNDTVPTCICKSAQVITSHKLQKYWENSLKYVLKSLRKEEID